MNLLEVLLSSQNNAAVEQIGGKFGLDNNQMTGVLRQVVPALARGVQRNAGQADGLGSLLGALTGGNHQRYLDKPADLAGGAGIAEGIGILGHILGSKDASRNVAGRAASQTGVSADLIKQMLPMIATMVMAALSKQAGQQGMAGASARASGGSQSGDTLGMLNSFLDADRDGSAIDDVINLAQKFF